MSMDYQGDLPESERKKGYNSFDEKGIQKLYYIEIY